MNEQDRIQEWAESVNRHSERQLVAADRDQVLISVRAEVAANYLALRGFQAQLAAARESTTNQAASLRLALTLRDGGRGRGVA